MAREDMENGYLLEKQKKDLELYAEKHSYKLLQTYDDLMIPDNSFDKHDKSIDLPDFRKMITDIANCNDTEDKIDCVIAVIESKTHKNPAFIFEQEIMEALKAFNMKSSLVSATINTMGDIVNARCIINVALGQIKIYVPKDLEDCFVALKRILSKEQIKEIKKATKDSMATHHFGIGWWMRNNWGLYSGSSHLSKWFNQLGITHADDMSGIILRSFWRHLNSKPINFAEQVDYYQKYEKTMKKHIKTPLPKNTKKGE